jgi:hypothetical protein
MTQADTRLSTPRSNTSATNQFQKLRDLGLRIEHAGGGRYRIVWPRYQLVIVDCDLLECALFVDRARLDLPQSSQEQADELLAHYRLARAAGVPAAQRLEDGQ